MSLNSLRLPVLLFGLFICALPAFAQLDKPIFGHNNTLLPTVSLNYQKGEIMPTTEFVKGDNLLGQPMTDYQCLALKLLWQNPSSNKDWQRIYKSPYYGIGVTVHDFYNQKEVGRPWSGYGILGIPIKRWNKLEMFYEFQLGIASNWTKYDSITNPKNMAIGGGMTVHLNMGAHAFYPITKHLDLGAGLTFIHFSNGGFERPNQGFNIYAPSVELKYYIQDKPKNKSLPSPGRLDRSNDFFIMLGYGDHQLVEHALDSNYFAVGGISGIYFNQLSNAFRLGLGADANYWWGLNANEDGTPGPYSYDNISLGFNVQPEFVMGKLSLVGGIGIYSIHQKYGNFNQTYQRLGARYEFYKDISIGFNIRAINFMLAEFLEFNLGYRIKKMK